MSFVLNEDPESLRRRIILDLAAKRINEFGETQALYLIACAGALLVTEAWAVFLGYALAQISEAHGMLLARRILRAAESPAETLGAFARPALLYELSSAFMISAGIAIGMMNMSPEWHLGGIALWCLAAIYFIFPTLYLPKALYGCIIIHTTLMTVTILFCQSMDPTRTVAGAAAALGLAVFTGTCAAFIGRQVRSDYLCGLARERVLGKTVRELDRQNAAKTDFVGHLSHELRTPLNGLMGMAALVRRDSDNPQQIERLDVMLKSGADLVRLLNDSLDLTRLEADAIKLQTASNSLAELLREQVSLYSGIASDKGLQIDLSVDSDVPDWLLFDNLRVMQCVGSLLNNAIKFSDRGQIRVRATYDRSDATPIVRISVRDQGIGIPPERLESIFNPYAQVQTGTARRYAGAGLGLAIARRLAHLMGGDLVVESTVGAGSTFQMTFIAIEAPLSPDWI